MHVPFCLTRCGYCDFNAYADLGHLRSRYVAALCAEADVVAPSWDGVHFDTVFLGGGTPTTLETAELIALLAHLRSRFDIAEGAEVTIEANPDTVDRAMLSELYAAGYGRLSMGVQSFDGGVLGSLERVHSADSARGAFGAARRAGYGNVNLDLIYGAEGESLAAWGATLGEAVALGPEHVSAYALTVESNTPLGRQIASGVRPDPDPDLQADMFGMACEVLGAAGYEHYEVSNWAKAGFECRHNQGYWRRQPYVGLGAGAHSYRNGRRWWNTRPPEAYLQQVESGVAPTGGEEFLTPEEARTEEFFLRLRTSEGIAAEDVDPSRADPYLREGLLVRRNDSYVLTERGMFLANEVVLALTG